LLPGACVVAENTVRGTAGSGIVAQLVSGIKVTDNTVEQTGQRGIYLASTTGSEVTGNHVSEASLEVPGRYAAIELASSSNENLVANNVCRVGEGQRDGVLVGPGCQGNRLFGNVTVPSTGAAAAPGGH
jgi:parallel beta-helix repeat protein